MSVKWSICAFCKFPNCNKLGARKRARGIGALAGWGWCRARSLLNREEVGVLELDLRRNAARGPVLDALHAAVLGVAEQFRDLGGSAQIFNPLFVVAHWVACKLGLDNAIKHHV